MDPVSLKLLEAEIKDQLNSIEQVYIELEDRASLMQPDTPAQIESAAYQLHNLYTAIEDLLKIVAGAFENNVADLSRWHSLLLHRMSLSIEGVRPALISVESADLLNELRAFRHRFRHAYGRRLDYHRVIENLAFAHQLRPLLWRDITIFLSFLGLSTEAKEL